MYTFVEQLFEPVEIRMFPLTAVDCGVAAVRDLEGHFHILFTTSLTLACQNEKLILAGFFFFMIVKVHYTFRVYSWKIGKRGVHIMFLL